MADRLREQIDLNYQAFLQQLPALVISHPGKFALMRDGQIIEFFDTARDTYVAGQRLFEQDKLFSVQEVTETPVDLGFLALQEVLWIRAHHTHEGYGSESSQSCGSRRPAA
jgi:hypothetical protein